MKYAIINGKKYLVKFGEKYTTFKQVGTVLIRTVKTSTRVSDLPRLLK